MQSLASIFLGQRSLTEEGVSMVKALHSLLSGPLPMLLHLSWNAKALTKDSTLASILKSPLQGQESICIPDDGQSSYGLPKDAQSVISRNWLRIPIVIISLYHTCPGQCSRWAQGVNQDTFRRGKGIVSDWLQAIRKMSRRLSFAQWGLDDVTQ